MSKLLQERRAVEPLNLLMFSPEIWLDGADKSIITLNGSDVSQWGDKSGNGHHATQGTAALQPAYSSLNGRNVITFDGSNFLNISHTYGATATWFLVATKSTSADYLMCSNVGGGAPYFVSKFNPGSGVKDFEGAVLGYRGIFATTATAGLHLLNMTSDDNDKVIGYYDGSEVFNGVPAVPSIGRTLNYLGAGPAGGPQFVGTMSEFVVFDRIITKAEREVISSYLLSKWEV